MSFFMLPPPRPVEKSRPPIVLGKNLLEVNKDKATELWFTLARCRLYSFQDGIISHETATMLATEYLFESPLSPEERVRARDQTAQTIIQESKDLWWYIMHCVLQPMITEWMDESDARWAIFKTKEEPIRLGYWYMKIKESRDAGRHWDAKFACCMDSIIAVDWVYTVNDNVDVHAINLRMKMRQYFENKLVLLAELVFQWSLWKKELDIRNPYQSQEKRANIAWESVCMKLSEIKSQPKMLAIYLPIETWPCHNTFLWERDVDMVNAVADKYILVPGTRRQQPITVEAQQKYTQWQKENEASKQIEAAKQTENDNAIMKKSKEESDETKKVEDETKKVEAKADAATLAIAAQAAAISRAWSSKY